MQCLSPLKVVNPKYKGDTIEPESVFDYYLEVPCGRCFACLKNRAANWKCRLSTEMQHSVRSVFVTLSIDNEHYQLACDNHHTPIRRFLELYRRYFKTSCKHWFVTELGDTTQRLHYHGLMFDYKCDLKWIHDHWIYGNVWTGFCNNRTIGYIVKYITKPQSDVCPEWYYPKVFTSPGLGKKFLDNPVVTDFHKRTENQLMRVGSCRYTMPRYFRDKIFDKEKMSAFYYDKLKKDFENGFSRCVDGILFTSPSSYRDYISSKGYEYDRIGGFKKTQKNPIKRKYRDPIDTIKDFISPDFN